MAPKNSGKEWRDEEVKKLKKLSEGNTPTGVIALKMGRSKNAIFSKAAVEGISLRPTNKSPYNRRKS